MITVSRISGESFDLNTGRELPKSIALTNGHREVFVVVDDEIVQEIIKMEMESRNQLPETPAAGRPSVPPHRPPVSPSSNVRVNPELAYVVPELAELPDEPSDAPEEETSETGPGVEYEDPATGVPSL
jgi:hypothetical protein